MSSLDSLLREVVEAKIIFRDLSFEHWIKHELFTWVWWLSLFLSIVPLLIWWKIVDRKRLLEIVIFGLITNVQASFLDVLGSGLVLWEYPIRLMPHTPLIFPADFIFLPIAFMLVYQYFYKWKGFLIGIVVTSAIISFILEPIAVLINQYVLFSWKFIYSFPIYILAAIVSRLITEKILHKSMNSSSMK